MDFSMKFSEATESASRGFNRDEEDVVLCRIKRIHEAIIRKRNGSGIRRLTRISLVKVCGLIL